MAELTANWYAIYVKSRHEFKVVERLTKSGIEAFLPAVERIRKWKDRKKLIKFPLFPGYLFVRIEKSYDLILRTLKTPGVVRMLYNANGQPEAVPEDQIIPLKIAIENKKEIDPYPYLKEGQTVRIKSGAFQGITGILKKKEKTHYLIVSIDILKRSVCIKIDTSLVELV